MSYFDTFNKNLDIPNCLTPNNFEDSISSKVKSISSNLNCFSSSTSTQPPLSPPLSPYQRNLTLYSKSQPSNYNIQSVKQLPSYLPSKSEFKIENYKDYKLTINIKPITKSYYHDQLSFLDKYSTIASNEERNKKINNLPTRSYKKRNVYYYDSPTDDETRVRTRRIHKQVDSNTDDEISLPILSSPKRRKVNTTPTVNSQQQSLIDDSIPDYSPDYSTLPSNNPKCLKIEWKGQPMDLSNDPNIDKLHPAEVLLASILRLPVIIYLDSKKRLFFEKVSRMKIGKQFRRTDAQKACRIDVNKASRLFAAFEKVGWLNDELFEKYL
ncbi:unnamed protein product [Candida verbasci]|uniref:SWIRM domain-containing protein n=1 Tax=Candida verbasci TaxID=1227364 RepID=A0A9W4TY15_9ASCO|nr:unnamed protein product [Candida verbasci]